jgi:hypothetical protein
MSASSGPSIQTDGLTFLMDVANPACINASSCVGYNNATQLIKNLVRQSDVTSSSSTLRLGNLNYFTAFAIDYPESSYGGAAASRQGLTPGFNVTSGAKTYDASRALHLWVWNNDTSNWVADSFFTGERLSGHCYDSYVGTAEVDKWVVDFNKIKNTFSNITVIAMGSHRDSYHTTAQYEILRDLGAPSNVDSIIGFSSPEWILVGEPGIGAGNGAWSFQNYSTDPSLVAHMNFGIPFKGNTSNYLNFNGSSDYISLPASVGAFGTGNFTINCWWKSSGTQSNYVAIMEQGFTGSPSNGAWAFKITHNTSIINFTYYNGGIVDNLSSFNINDGAWHNYLAVRSGTNLTLYVDGVSRYSLTLPAGYSFGEGSPVFVGYNPRDGTYINGSLPVLSTYNRALSATEIQQNFNAQRTRYGI